MTNTRVLSLKRLGIIALSVVALLVCILGVTLSALTDSKNATGTIVFTGNLAIAMQHSGTSGVVTDTTLTLQLQPDYSNLVDASQSGNVYFQDMTGDVASLNWATSADNIVDDLTFSVYSDGQTNSYIRFKIDLTYTPADSANLPASAQEWQVFPKFGSADYEINYTEIQEGDNIEYSYYAPSDRMIIAYPEFTSTSTSVTKTFYAYFLAEDFENLQSFAPTSADTSLSGYTYLNKSVNFSDVISDINFLLDGAQAPSSGDTFSLSITCDASTFPQI